MPGGFEPQTDVRIGIIPCDMALETSPLITALTLLACPDGANMRMELLSVSFRANTLPVDSSNDVHVDIEFVDDSDSDSVTDLADNYDMLAAGSTVLVCNEVWRGSQILDPGDVINAEFTVTTPDTASEGAALIVEYRVLQHS